MQDKVKEFIEHNESIRLESKRRQQEKHLIELGLYEHEYAGDGQRSAEYSIWDPLSSKFYRKVPYEVTDEEYAAICSYDKPQIKTVKTFRPQENPIAKTLKVVGWLVIVFGSIAGLILANETSYGEFDWGIAISTGTQAVISGITFFGFAEIIRLLQSIRDKQDKDL